MTIDIKGSENYFLKKETQKVKYFERQNKFMVISKEIGGIL